MLKRLLFVIALLALGSACMPLGRISPLSALTAPARPSLPAAVFRASPASPVPATPTNVPPETILAPHGTVSETGSSAEPSPFRDVILVGAGDIAACDSPGAAETAKLLEGIAGTIITLGDNAYPSGTSEQFADCYAPTWGQFKARTRPAPGNHDYVTPGAAGYFGYFGPAAGDPSKGYYSYDLETWHIVVLNSNCWAVGGCGAGSPQEQWLRADLASHPAGCTLAYWHHPRFSSGPHGNNDWMQPIWQALYEARADVVLSGHDHDYERFAPQDAAGRLDLAHGIREFVVGTGGQSHYTIRQSIVHSEVSNSDTFGVLKVTLRPAGYDWQFVPVAGKSFADSGSADCH